MQYKHAHGEWSNAYQTIDQNPCTLVGLTQGMEYQVRVRAVCSDTETSNWTEPVNFVTNYTAPFFEEFCNYLDNYGNLRDILPGWQWADAMLDDVLAGTVPLELTAYNNRWYNGGGTFANSDNGMIYRWNGGFYCGNINITHSWMVTPNIELGDGWKFSFDMALSPLSYTSSVTDDDRFSVLVTDDNGATWTKLREWNNAEGSTYNYNDIPSYPTEVNFDLSAYNNKTVRFAFYVESTVENGGSTAASNTILFSNVNVTQHIRPELIVASDVTTTSAALSWTGHGENAWTLQYRIVGNGEWTTVSNITTQPFTLEGLHTHYYEVRVKAHEGTGISEWSDNAIFTPECAPISLGLGETYEEHFDGRLFPTCWERTGTASWLMEGYYEMENGNLVWKGNMYARYEKNKYASLVMPQIEVTSGMCLTFRHANSFSTGYQIKVQISNNSNFASYPNLGYVTDDLWDTDVDDYSSGETTLPLNNYAGQTLYVRFYYSCNNSISPTYINPFWIDDVKLSNINTFIKQTDLGYWNETANWSAGVLPQAGESVTITGKARIPNGYLAQADEVYLTKDGSLVIEDGGQLKHNNAGVAAKVRKTIIPYTIAQTNGDQKTNGWYLIASPMEEPMEPNESVLANQFDLYRFNQSAELEWENYQQHFYMSPYFKLYNGQGYLYANSGDGFNDAVTVEMEGQLRPGSEELEIGLNYDVTSTFAGWNLVGNPYAYNVTTYAATKVDDGCFRMNDARDDLMVSEVSADDPLRPMEGFFVKANDVDANITFGASGSGAKGNEEGSIFVEVEEHGKAIDRLIVKTEERKPLEKLSLSDRRTKVYARRDHGELAIVSSEGNEQAVCFKAEKSGTYTITVRPKNVELAYLHLIDNLTGADVDLLGEFPLCKGGQGDSNPTYTFTAKTTDYESRFKLMFSSVCEDADGDNAFAFISNGNIIVNGTGTLQVFDVLGRQALTKELSTVNSQLSTVNFPAGVYVLRLIQGDDVKTQKIVID